MTEHKNGEVRRPAQRSSEQIIGELVERFAIDIQNDNEDHRQYMSQYPLPEGSLGLASIGQPDVAFEKFIDLDTDGRESNICYTIFIGCGSDSVLAIKSVDGELYGGYGESGLAGDDVLDPDDVRHLLTKLAAEMWLYERGLSATELTKETVAKAVVTLGKALVCTLVDKDDPDGDAYDIYPIKDDEHIWTALKAERSWVSETDVDYRLSLMDGNEEIIELIVLEATRELLLTNYAGTEFDGSEATRRTRILFTALAEAIASGQITPKVTI